MTTRTKRTIPLLLALAALWAATGCEINSPEMPSFDTAFVLPLGDETLTVLEAVEDEDFLLADEDGGLGFELTGDPDTLQLDFDLAVDLPATAVAAGLGDFALPAVTPAPFGFALGDLWPPSAGAGGVTTIVPPFDFNLTSGGEDIPDITSATLSSGRLDVTLTNGLAVAIGADSGPDQVVLSVIDPVGGGLVARIVFPAVPAGASVSRSADLAGAVLPDDVAMRVAGGSPGSGLAMVTINGSDTIAVEASFADLVVSSATAVVGAQAFGTTVAADLPAEYEITRAVIASGMLDMTLANPLPVTCDAVVVWPQVRDVGGVPLVRTFSLAPGTSLVTGVDLSGHVIQADGAALTSLDVQVDVTTAGSGGTPVVLDAGATLAADIAAGALTFASVTGVVPEFSVPLDPITETIDLPDGLSGLSLAAATLEIELTNTSGVGADVDFALAGTAADGTVRTLNVSEQIQPAIDRAPTVTTIRLDETNSTILDFLNNLPETVTLDGTVVAGGGAAGTVRADDFAVVGWRITAPVAVIVDGATLDSDPEALDIDADLRERIASHARGAELQAEITSHLPLAVELRVVAHTDTTLLGSAPLLVVGPVSVAAGQIDPVTGQVIAATVSTPTISLTEAEAQLFGLPGLHTRVEAVLPSNGGQAVRLMTTDYLEFRGVVQLEVLIDDEL